jgi:hypothetical protein
MALKNTCTFFLLMGSLKEKGDSDQISESREYFEESCVQFSTQRESVLGDKKTLKVEFYSQEREKLGCKKNLSK